MKSIFLPAPCLYESVSLIGEGRDVSMLQALAVCLEGGGVVAQVLVAQRHQTHHGSLLVADTHRHL